MKTIRSTSVRSAALLVLVLSMFAGNAMAAGANVYPLTETALDQYERATEAMYAFMIEHPEMRAAMETADPPDMDDPAALARHFDEYLPGLRDQMERTGMSLADYYAFAFTLAANAFGLARAEQYGGPEETTLTDTQRANLDFVRRNSQRFEQFSARMQRQYGPLDDAAAE